MTKADCRHFGGNAPELAWMAWPLRPCCSKPMLLYNSCIVSCMALTLISSAATYFAIENRFKSRDSDLRDLLRWRLQTTLYHEIVNIILSVNRQLYSATKEARVVTSSPVFVLTSCHFYCLWWTPHVDFFAMRQLWLHSVLFFPSFLCRATALERSFFIFILILILILVFFFRYFFDTFFQKPLICFT